MGQTTSSANAAHPFPSLALHCLRVAESSPAAQAGIEPFFDYLVGVDGASAVQGLSPEELSSALEENEGREIGLRVYSAKTQKIRHVSLTPSRAWSTLNKIPHPSDDSPSAAQPSLLGLSLRLCNPAQALESVWHILEVLEGSPAEMAGLVPWGDYVIGWSGGVLHSESDFYDLVESHADKPLRLYVYSSDFDNLREVVLYPTRQWGGEGLLGCGVGYGLLHRIPRPATPPPVQAADGYFPTQTVRHGSAQSHANGDSDDAGFFVPASLPQTSPVRQ